jgi:hypothetical protein
MFLQVNHSEANSGGKKEFEPIAEGKYQAIIKEAEIAKSSSGNDMIKVTLVIRDDVQQQYGKRKVWDYIVASEKAKWKMQQVAKAIGLEQGKQIASIQEFAKEILYKPVTISIKHEQDEYNGETKTRERIGFYDVAEVPAGNTQSDPFATPPTTNNNVAPF